MAITKLQCVSHSMIYPSVIPNCNFLFIFTHFCLSHPFIMMKIMHYSALLHSGQLRAEIG